MHQALRVTRNRYLLLPLGAIVVVLLSYAMLAIGGANGRPNRPPSAAVQDPVTQPEPPAAGTGFGSADPADTDRRIAFWQQRINANPTSDQQYVYLGELYAQKGRETGDVGKYALAEQSFRKALDLYANLRPVRCLSERLCPLRNFAAKDIDFVVFRENTEGAYAGLGG